MMIDDKEGFAGMIINYGDAMAKDTAIELGTDANSARIRLNGQDGLPRAKLNVDGTNKPAWQFDGTESAAIAAKTQGH